MSNHTAPTATVDLEDGLASATVKEPRPEVLAMFGELTAAQRDQLAVEREVDSAAAASEAPDFAMSSAPMTLVTALASRCWASSSALPTSISQARHSGNSWMICVPFLFKN